MEAGYPLSKNPSPLKALRASIQHFFFFFRDPTIVAPKQKSQTAYAQGRHVILSWIGTPLEYLPLGLAAPFDLRKNLA